MRFEEHNAAQAQLTIITGPTNVIWPLGPVTAYRLAQRNLFGARSIRFIAIAQLLGGFGFDPMTSSGMHNLVSVFILAVLFNRPRRPVKLRVGDKPVDDHPVLTQP